MTTQQNAYEVSVQLSHCGQQDAEAVFGVLGSLFSSSPDRAARTVTPRREHATVWALTVDAASESGAPARSARLSGPVDASLSGGHQGVDRVREALAGAFRVVDRGSVAGDQEVEVRLELGSGDAPEAGAG
ncbi:hypothetical protein [Streptomyces sp. TP-A0874]|uniref:hypothetical protein n=1 Tax=Streptomyces sp. TP-A0874 TaxID=549819 RepID=UPI000852E4DD|nr:hypothetical protein [Streptomyces sp. TP-A0874]